MTLTCLSNLMEPKPPPPPHTLWSIHPNWLLLHSLQRQSISHHFVFAPSFRLRQKLSYHFPYLRSLITSVYLTAKENFLKCISDHVIHLLNNCQWCLTNPRSSIKCTSWPFPTLVSSHILFSTSYYMVQPNWHNWSTSLLCPGFIIPGMLLQLHPLTSLASFKVQFSKFQNSKLKCFLHVVCPISMKVI